MSKPESEGQVLNEGENGPLDSYKELVEHSRRGIEHVSEHYERFTRHVMTLLVVACTIATILGGVGVWMLGSSLDEASGRAERKAVEVATKVAEDAAKKKAEEVAREIADPLARRVAGEIATDIARRVAVEKVAEILDRDNVEKLVRDTVTNRIRNIAEEEVGRIVQQSVAKDINETRELLEVIRLIAQASLDSRPAFEKLRKLSKESRPGHSDLIEDALDSLYFTHAESLIVPEKEMIDDFGDIKKRIREGNRNERFAAVLKLKSNLDSGISKKEGVAFLIDHLPNDKSLEVSYWIIDLLRKWTGAGSDDPLDFEYWTNWWNENRSKPEWQVEKKQ